MSRWQEIIAVAMVGASLAYVARNLWRSLIGGKGCRDAGGCGVAAPSLIEIDLPPRKKNAADRPKEPAGGE